MELTISQNSSSVTAAIDYVAFLGFTTYNLDASPITNPSQIVQTEDIDNTQTSIMIDPTWMLAALSASAGATQTPDHASSQQLSTLMNTLLSIAAQQPNPSTSNLSDADQDSYYYLTMILIAETLSIIDINSTPAATTSSSRRIKDPLRPLLYRTARMNVWAFNADSSRTAILGTVVAIIGIVVTLIQFVVSIVDRRPFRSSTQLLVAALQHVPRDEFSGSERSEEATAKVRFHVREVGQDGQGSGKGAQAGAVGRLRFWRTEG